MKLHKKLKETTTFINEKNDTKIKETIWYNKGVL